MKKRYIKPCFEIEELDSASVIQASYNPDPTDPTDPTQQRQSDLDGVSSTVGGGDGYGNGRDTDGNGTRAKGWGYTSWDCWSDDDEF